MTVIKIPVLSPIRLYDPNLEYDNNTIFQNPDNRVSTGYNWEAVNPMQYALPIPKQWPDYQPGIDFMINVESGIFYADLYDANDAFYKSCYVDLWEVVGSDSQYRIWLDGESGSGIADGFYTVKIFDNTDDALLWETEALLIADWFEDSVPFEFWNFENDFGLTFDNGVTRFTGRAMVPIRIYDPEPVFEKEIYENDPGTKITLRTIIQRQFNFDSMVVPVHVAEMFQMAFACSELYLDRIQINSEEAPAAELIEGSNLKQLSGTANLVGFPGAFMREKVETTLTDEGIDWATSTYVTSVITNNEIVVTDLVVAGGPLRAQSDTHTYVDNDIVVVKVVLTDNGTSDFPLASFDGGQELIKEWGTNWFSYRVNDDSSSAFRLWSNNGDRANYTAVLTFFSVS